MPDRDPTVLSSPILKNKYSIQQISNCLFSGIHKIGGILEGIGCKKKLYERENFLFIRGIVGKLICHT
jgi:hypothetical protein